MGPFIARFTRRMPIGTQTGCRSGLNFRDVAYALARGMPWFARAVLERKAQGWPGISRAFTPTCFEEFPMSKLARAIAVAFVTIGFAASAQAATYVVSAKSLSFDAQLARKVEAAGGTITARLPQIGVAIIKSDDADFAARASKIPGIRSAVQDLTLHYKVPEAIAMTDADFANPPTSGEDDI